MAGNDDIVVRLRSVHKLYNRGPDYEPFVCGPTPLQEEAAAEIERLRTALAERDATIERLTRDCADFARFRREAAARATTAERERDEARAEVERLMRVFRVPGCALFLDGRNEHGSHVIMSYPTNMPENVEDDISESAEEVLSAAEALGFVVGEDHVWTEWRWIEPQIGDEGRVELRGYWEFVRIDQGLSRAALTAKGGENAEG